MAEDENMRDDHLLGNLFNMSAWQENLVKIGAAVLVILVSAVWFCWTRLQVNSWLF